MKELLQRILRELEYYEEGVELDRGKCRSIEELEAEGELPQIIIDVRKELEKFE